MTFQTRSLRSFCALILTLIAAIPAAAQTRKRAVTRPPVVTIAVSGTVTDATTGLPLKGVGIATEIGGSATDAAGHYTVNAYKGNGITASRAGYVTTVRAATGNVVDIALPQSPTVTVRITGGQSFALDASTVKFGYAQVFQGYAAGDTPNLCHVTGATAAPWELAKSDFSRIVGPAHAVSSAPCCDKGPVMAIDVELKNGERGTGYLTDNCFGYEVDVLGIERASAQPKYIHLTDITEIVFP